MQQQQQQDCDGLDAIAAVYLPKFAASLSIIGSFLIITEIGMNLRASRGGTTAISRTLLSMSIGDVIYSFGWFMGTWVMPPDNNSELSGLLTCGAKFGNTSTCTFQAFILQFGGTASVLFGTCLAFHFLLLTREEWTEAQVGRVEKRLQIASWVLSFLGALAYIPFDLYHPAGSICYVSKKVQVCDPDNNNNCWYEYTGNRGNAVTILLEHIPIVYVIFVPWVSCVLLNIAIVGFIYRHLRRIEAKEKAKQQKQQRQRGVVSSPQKSLTEIVTMFDQSSKRTGQHDPSLPSGIGDVNHTPQATELRHTPEGENEDSDFTSDDDYVADREHTEHSIVTTESSLEQKRSIMMAKQGIWYTVGFLGTFGLTFVSCFVVLATGESNETLDFFSYITMASLGLWNFFIFSRRRKMKTAVGRMAGALVWEHVFGVVPMYRMISRCLSRCTFFSKGRDNTAEENNPLEAAPRPPNHDLNPNFTPFRQPNFWEGFAINHQWFQPGDQIQSINPPNGTSERPSHYNSKVSWKESLVSELGASKIVDVDFAGTRFRGHVGNTEQQDQSPAKPTRYHSDANPLADVNKEHSSYEQESAPKETQQPPPIKRNASVESSPQALPIRSTSEVLTLVELSEYDSCLDSNDGCPEKGSRLSSASNHTSPPTMPQRIASEIEEQVLQPRDNLRASTHSSPPAMLRRLASEDEEVINA